MSTASRFCLLSLGSNLGDRRYHLRRAIRALRDAVTLVRVSSVWETQPVDAPFGSPPFLNLVAAGMTNLLPESLLLSLLEIERRLGRRRRVPNEPRAIDIDLIFYDALRIRSPLLELPHPRYHDRAFVLEPLRELRLPWIDPRSGRPLMRLRVEGEVRRLGPL